VGETKFAELGRDRVAYQVLGDGPDLVLLTGTLSHVDVRWGDPQHAQFLRRLASFSRLILLDPRGCGASDPIPLDPLPTPSARRRRPYSPRRTPDRPRSSTRRRIPSAFER
jgi:pimeloyl-ACP methyl ester carboxylesterase